MSEKPALPPGVHEDGDIDWPLIFKLSKPITAFDDELSAIELREPTAQDAVKYGLLSNGVHGEMWIDLMSDLTKVPKGSLMRMTAKDTMRLTKILAGFFFLAAV